jgi:uncharacterized membrane protein YbaN (DUF454 family)
MPGPAMRLVWIAAGWIAVAAGVIGIFLPLVPTTPFLLLAAVAFAKASPRFHAWLTGHPRLGPPIEAWRESGAISPRAKAAAVVMLAASIGLSLLMGVPHWALAAQVVVIMAVAAFLLTRPNG